MFPAQLCRLGARVRDRMPRVGVGIDIGRSALRVAVLRDDPGGTELVGLGSAPSPSGAGSSPDPAMLREVLQRACKGCYWWPRRAAMGVAAGAVLARSLQVDAEATLDEVADAVERAARQLPVGQAELSLAWAPLAPGSVLMVAARREAVLTRQRLAVRAGLGPVMVDVDLFAGLRAIHPASDGGDGARPCLLVDAGSDSVRALAWVPGTAPVLRVLPVPPACTIESLADLVAEAVRGSASGLMAAPEPSVTLAGGRAAEEGVLSAVAARTGVACRLAEPFNGLLDPQGLALMPGSVAALWPSAVGLARRALA